MPPLRGIGRRRDGEPRVQASIGSWKLFEERISCIIIRQVSHLVVWSNVYIVVIDI